MYPHEQNHHLPWWRSPANWILLVVGAIALFFLLRDHTAHVLGVLPYLLFLLCPLMMLFMHRGHGGHEGRGGQQDMQQHHQHPNTASREDETEGGKR